MEDKNKRASCAIVIPQSALSFVLELLKHDNPQLKPQIEKIQKAYNL